MRANAVTEASTMPLCGLRGRLALCCLHRRFTVPSLAVHRFEHPLATLGPRFDAFRDLGQQLRGVSVGETKRALQERGWHHKQQCGVRVHKHR